MNYCLRREEFSSFFDVLLNDKQLDNNFEEELQMRIDACCNWEDSLGIMLYVFTHYLQKKKKDTGIINSEQLTKVLTLNEIGNFVVETLDRDFILYMMSYNRAKINEELADTLVLIHQNYLDHTYDSSFCF
ncbi:hypothetical protein [Pedobacter rhodius]|uniref:Uncharacterized protein n=1 Tax=Pedobacter rhodius TaxID=3004098 RepID=A0ABT4KSM8_9SPHI|nr:hypothetical protein [Pedobacter sp. SJ11]MCZ4221937.1 hypothetical protein [Pedobacter sp. SJ11]